MKTTNDLGFNGMTNGNNGGYNSKYQKNAWSGHANDGRLVNKGTGPRKGNTGTPGPTTPALGSQSKSLRGGGTTVPAGKEYTNVGRGPTKGTQAKCD